MAKKIYNKRSCDVETMQYTDIAYVTSPNGGGG